LDSEAGSFSTCPCLTLVVGVGSYVLARVERRGLACMYFLFCGFRVVGVCVRVYTSAYTHTT